MKYNRKILLTLILAALNYIQRWQLEGTLNSTSFYFGVILIFLKLKIEMDDKLKEILKIRPLQIECIAYRSFTNEYRVMMKRACVYELKNLMNVEMKIDQFNLKLPKEDEIPNITTEIKKCKADCLLKECSVIERGLNMLS